MKASFIHGKPNVEKLEKAARALLGYPCLPDGANGPRGQAILAQIQADVASLGHAAALEKHAGLGHGVTGAYQIHLDDDPPWQKSLVNRPVQSLEHPTNPGAYLFPDDAHGRLRAALDNPEARARCSAEALAALDDHRARIADVPEDWEPST